MMTPSPFPTIVASAIFPVTLVAATSLGFVKVFNISKDPTVASILFVLIPLLKSPFFAYI